jgi:hypothetical protein
MVKKHRLVAGIPAVFALPDPSFRVKNLSAGADPDMIRPDSAAGNRRSAPHQRSAIMLVEIPVTRAALGRTLNRMREWLDARHCETRSFRELAMIGGIVLQIGFPGTADAKAFADRFGGTMTPETETPILERDRA